MKPLSSARAKKPKPGDTGLTEVYLLKIYRRETEEEGSLVGTLEEISGPRKGNFKTARALLRCLGMSKESHYDSTGT
jgi:hypothetical protein